MRFLLAAVVYGAACAAVMVTPAGESAAGLAILVIASIAAGLISQSWWAVLLALFLPVAAQIEGCGPTDQCEVEPWFLALVVMAPVAAVLIGLGVGARKLSGR